MAEMMLLVRTVDGVEDMTPYVSRFVYRSSLLLGRTLWSMEFDSPIWDFWKDMMQGNPVVFDAKIQTSRTPNNREESPWLTLKVDQAKARIKTGSIAGTMVGGGNELAMMVEAKRRAFMQLPISSVIQQIASLYGLTPVVDASSLVSDWYQTNQSDWDFLQELMAYYIPSASNRGDAYLNVEGTNLTVKAIEYANPAVRLYDLTSGEDDRPIQVDAQYYGGQVDRRGGIVTEVRGFDKATGLPVTWTVSPATSSQPALAPKLPKSITNRKQVVIDPHSSLDFIKARALREQARHGTRYYGIAIQLIDDLTIRLRDMIEISMADDEGEESPYHGRYGVHEYTFDYNKSGVTVNVIGYRKEAYEGEQVAIGADLSRSTGTDMQQTQSGREPIKKVAVPIGS